MYSPTPLPLTLSLPGSAPSPLKELDLGSPIIKTDQDDLALDTLADSDSEVSLYPSCVPLALRCCDASPTMPHIPLRVFGPYPTSYLPSPRTAALNSTSAGPCPIRIAHELSA